MSEWGNIFQFCNEPEFGCFFRKKNSPNAAILVLCAISGLDISTMWVLISGFMRNAALALLIAALGISNVVLELRLRGRNAEIAECQNSLIPPRGAHTLPLVGLEARRGLTADADPKPVTVAFAPNDPPAIVLYAQSGCRPCAETLPQLGEGDPQSSPIRP